jgi:diacylglycerol kinase
MGKLYTYHPPAINNGFVKSRWLALGNALRGIGLCLKKEIHFQLQMLVAVMVVAVGLLLGLSKLEWVVIGFCITLILAFEAINTAIEHLCNVVSTDYHPGIKTVKDVAAGAVLLAAVGSCIAGLVIFLPKIFSYFN